MHASDTIPYWDSWYTSGSHFPLQWSLTPDIETGFQLKVRTFRMLLITSYVNDIKIYKLQERPVIVDMQLYLKSPVEWVT